MNEYTGNSFVSDVTPWWWASHWDACRQEIGLALSSLRAIAAAEVELVELSREKIRVTFAVHAEDDPAKLQNYAEDLRWFLNELVKPAEREHITVN